MEFSSQPERNFTVTGTLLVATTAFVMAYALSISFIRALPLPFPAILGTGQPILISRISGLYFISIAAALAQKSGSSPNICKAYG